jgi:hypothetical protein
MLFGVYCVEPVCVVINGTYYLWYKTPNTRVIIDTVKHNILFNANNCYYKLCESTDLCILYPPSLLKPRSYQLTLCTVHAVRACYYKTSNIKNFYSFHKHLLYDLFLALKLVRKKKMSILYCHYSDMETCIFSSKIQQLWRLDLDKLVSFMKPFSCHNKQ